VANRLIPFEDAIYIIHVFSTVPSESGTRRARG
jgi:hypothetical protein